MAKHDQEQTDAATDGPPSVWLWRRVRENAEAVIIAIILALIIRHYSLEAFEIPTGSMAPGLHGVHIDATCPNCGTVEPVGVRVHQFNNKLEISLVQGWIYEGTCPECSLEIRDGKSSSQQQPPPPQIRCPQCNKFHPADSRDFTWSPGFAREVVYCHECTYEFDEYFEPSDAQGGHKILVNKFAYHANRPERWQVIVFKFNRQRNYIKRLVGLSGESIEVIDGDIHIDGEIERKPLEVQQEMWFPIHDTDIHELGLNGHAWEEEGVFAPREEGGLEFNALDGQSALRYIRPIRNVYSYNGAQGGNTDASLVRDLRAVVDLEVRGKDSQGSPRFAVDIRNGEIVYRLSLPIDEGTGEVIRLVPEVAGEMALPESRRELTEDHPGDWSVFATLPEGTRLITHRHHEVDFSLVDRQIRIAIDGVLVLEQPVDPRDFDAGVGFAGRVTNDITLRARHSGGVVERVRLARDIHYTRQGMQYKYAVNGAYQIPDDGYFAMGDNSPSSLDSRAWGALRGTNLLGRAFVIFWPAWPWDFEMGFIR